MRANARPYCPELTCGLVKCANTAHTGKLPVQEIDTGLVLKVLEPIWSAKPETASRVRAAPETKEWLIILQLKGLLLNRIWPHQTSFPHPGCAG